MPILVRHETVAPFAQAAANASDFDAQQALNDQSLRFASFAADQQARQRQQQLRQQELAQRQAELNQDSARQEQYHNDQLSQQATQNQFENQQRDLDQQRFDAGQRNYQQTQDRIQASEDADRQQRADFNQANNARMAGTTFMNNLGRTATTALNVGGNLVKDLFSGPTTSQQREDRMKQGAADRATSARNDQMDRMLVGKVQQAKTAWDAVMNGDFTQDAGADLAAQQQSFSTASAAAKANWQAAVNDLNAFRGQRAGMSPPRPAQTQNAAPGAASPAIAGAASPAVGDPVQQAKSDAMNYWRSLPAAMTPRQKKQATAIFLQKRGYDLKAIGAL